LRPRGDRAHLRGELNRIAHLRRLCQREKLFDERIVNAAMNQRPRPGNAGLARRGENARNDAVDRSLDVGVFKYDVR